MYCKFCGAKNEDGSIFCMKCGKKLDENATVSPVAHKAAPAATPVSAPAVSPAVMAVKPTKNTKKTVIIISIVAVALIVAGVVGFLIFSNYQKKEAEIEEYNKNVKKCAANMKVIKENLDDFLSYGNSGNGFTATQLNEINFNSDARFLSYFKNNKLPTCPFNNSKYKIKLELNGEQVNYTITCTDPDCPNCKDE